MAEYVIGKERPMTPVTSFLMGVNLDEYWTVTIKKGKPSRSLQQNRLYHKWVGIIGRELGYDHDVMHHILASMFLPPVHTEFGGRVHESRRSTTSLKVGEMVEYMDHVSRFAAERGIHLPIPEEMHRRVA